MKYRVKIFMVFIFSVFITSCGKECGHPGYVADYSFMEIDVREDTRRAARKLTAYGYSISRAISDSNHIRLKKEYEGGEYILVTLDANPDHSIYSIHAKYFSYRLSEIIEVLTDKFGPYNFYKEMEPDNPDTMTWHGLIRLKRHLYRWPVFEDSTKLCVCAGTKRVIIVHKEAHLLYRWCQ